MNLEDFVIGKWYASSEFLHTFAFRLHDKTLNSLVSDGCICIEKKEYKEQRNHYNIVNYIGSGASFYKESFKEVPLSEIIGFLPKDHADVVEYLKNNSKERLHLLFPFEGCCESNQLIYNYIRGKKEHKPYASTDKVFNKSASHIKWFEFNGELLFTFLYARSSKVPNYDKEYILKTIDNISNKNNEIKNNTAEVHRSSQEIERSSRGRTITMGRSGQQVATGSRPRGNEARVVKTKSTSVRVEICAKIGQRSNS